MHSLGAMVQNVVLLAKMRKITIFLAGLSSTTFLSKTYSLACNVRKCREKGQNLSFVGRKAMKRLIDPKILF